MQKYNLKKQVTNLDQNYSNFFLFFQKKKMANFLGDKSIVDFFLCCAFLYFKSSAIKKNSTINLCYFCDKKKISKTDTHLGVFWKDA